MNTLLCGVPGNLKVVIPESRSTSGTGRSFLRADTRYPGATARLMRNVYIGDHEYSSQTRRGTEGGSEPVTMRLIDDRDVWDTFVDGSASGRLFHKWDFMKITQKHTGFMFLPYGVFKGNELICVFPLFQRQMHGLTVLLSPKALARYYLYHYEVQKRDMNS